MLLRFLSAVMLSAWLSGVCAADPLATLLASPCRDGDAETALHWELARHNWTSRGWTVRAKDTAYEITHTAALNKMSELGFSWRVEDRTVTATSPASSALCMTN